jgi:hypothetical protein
MNNIKKLIPYLIGFVLGVFLCFSFCTIKKSAAKKHLRYHKMFDFVQVSSYKINKDVSKSDFEDSIKSIATDLRKFDGLMSKTIFVDKDGVYYEVTSWKDEQSYKDSLGKILKSDSMILFSKNIDQSTIKTQDGEVVGFFFSKKHKKHNKDHENSKKDDEDDEDKERSESDTKRSREG